MTTCYDLAGNQLSAGYGPCNSGADGGASACCANVKSDSPDVCLDSGLCLAVETVHMGFLYENGCTDQTGSADGCPSTCAGVRDSTWTRAEVLQCIPGTWCCRRSGDTNNCCDDPATYVNRTFIGNLAFSALSPSTATASGTASPRLSEASTIAAASGSPSPATVLAISGVLGGLLFAAAMAFGAAVWMWRKERRRRRILEQGRVVYAPAEGLKEVFAGRHQGMPLAEVDGSYSARSELPARSY